jgi:hypothetical protein
MRALDFVKLRALPNFAIAKVATIAVCAVIVCYGAFLFFGHSPFFHGATMEAQRQQSLQGKLTVAAGDGAVCYRTLFDNRSSQIISIEKGPCRGSGMARTEDFHDPDGPLGSIRKALSGR